MEQFSGPSRVAELGEGVGLDELQLAARNHGTPAEALRHEITPVGLHYVLVHYDVPFVEPHEWRLQINGAVRHPMALDLAELRSRSRATEVVTLECAGNGRARLEPRPVSQPWWNDAVSTAVWTGTPLAPLLRQAEPETGAVDVVFTGHDHGVERGVEQDYQRALSLADAMGENVLLAYEMNAEPLPPQHGFPLRLIVPGWYGMAQVKWLRSITVTSQPFTGFQNAVAYRLKQHPDEAGEPVARIRPRALMIPPGFPDFMSRRRVVSAGEHVLEGRAWSGAPPVTSVQVSVDGGLSWRDADLEPAQSRWAWRRWTCPWSATKPGRCELLVRATDHSGEIQPVEQVWNVQGMANNAAQRITVIVR
ncbi:MAG: sulfite oxidase [Micromonosporaceae bacterium]